MQLTIHATRRKNTPPRFALGASNACLVRQNPTCSEAALWVCVGLWFYDYGHAWHEFPPPPYRTTMALQTPHLGHDGREPLHPRLEATVHSVAHADGPGLPPPVGRAPTAANSSPGGRNGSSTGSFRGLQ